MNELDNEKLMLQLNELKKEVEEVENMESYPFKPEIKEKNINKVLYGKNYWEEQANNLSNKINTNLIFDYNKDVFLE